MGLSSTRIFPPPLNPGLAAATFKIVYSLFICSKSLTIRKKEQLKIMSLDPQVLPKEREREREREITEEVK